MLDQAGDLLVVQSCFRGAFAIARSATEDWTEVYLCEVQPLFQRVHGAGLLLGAAAYLHLAPARLGIEGELGTLVEDLDPTARVRRVVLVDVKADDLRAAEAPSVVQRKDGAIP